MSHDNEHKHELTYKEPIKVFCGLVFLTLLTVFLGGVTENANLAIFFAMAVATIKAILVLAYFMHLKYEKAVFNWFLAIALGTFAIVFIMLFTDYSFRG